MDTSKIAIIGPGRLGTALAYIYGRNGRRVTMYYHDAEVCRAINTEHLNPTHLTTDLARLYGGMANVPRLAPEVTASSDLEQVVHENDFIFLTITMNRLSSLLDYLRPMIAKKRGKTCIISAIKGLVADEKTKELITPSQMIQGDLNHIQHKFKVVAMGGPFFDVDIALGKPVALTIAGPRSVAQTVRKEVLNFDRREITSYYNFDIVGIEACGALKNIVANIKGVTDRMNLGNSIPGTIFARSGVEIRSLARLLGGSFQAFYSQAGVGDLYVTLSSDASKNYRYGKLYYDLFDGNPIQTDKKVLAQIDGTPEGPNTIRNVYRYLEKKNMYSPIFCCAYHIFNETGDRKQIEEKL
ncbi:MAG: NAD(P)H-dependent glycerol-3-phosphate dehydrogenase, partial [Syntrophaceae bacterium]